MKWFKKAIGQADWQAMAKTELEEAKLALLSAETALDWAHSNVEYNLSRIERLERMLNHGVQSKLQPRENLSGV